MVKYLAKDEFYSMCTQEKETKTVAKAFFLCQALIEEN